LPLSAIDAISPAFQHARQQLMQPFRANQWAKLGLVGLLAGEMSSGGGGCNPGAFQMPTPPNHSQRFLEAGFAGISPAMYASMIAILVVTGVVLMVLFLYGVQVGFSAFVLRQVNRLDGLVPYLVADNWATFFVTIASTIVGIFGPAANFMLVVAAVLVLVIEINIARLIVTLSRWQIAMFLVAQIVGILIGLLIMGAIFPLPPDLVATPA